MIVFAFSVFNDLQHSVNILKKKKSEHLHMNNFL